MTDDAARGVLALAADSPTTDFLEEESQPHESDMGAGLWVYLLIGATIAAAMIEHAFPPLRYAPLLWASLLTFVIAYAALGFVAGLLLHGSSTSHDRWALLVGFNWGLVAALSFCGVTALNALADASQPIERVLTVIDEKEHTGRRFRKSYSVVVPAWDRPGESIEVSVSSDEYERILPGRAKIKLVTSPGLLNIEWIKSQELQQ